MKCFYFLDSKLCLKLLNNNNDNDDDNGNDNDKDNDNDNNHDFILAFPQKFVMVAPGINNSYITVSPFPPFLLAF